MGIMSDAHKRRSFATIRWVLLAVLGYAVIKTVAVVSGGNEVFSPSVITGAKSSTHADAACYRPKPSQDHSAIFQRNLFGARASSAVAKEPDAAAEESAPDRPASKEMAIALLGTVAGSREVSRAILEDLKTSALSLVKVGDTVGGASVESIEKDAVVLLAEGRRRTIRLGTAESKRREAGATESALASDSTRRFEGDRQARPPTSIAEKLRYAAAILPKATIEPYAVDGKIEGLKITGLEKIGHLEDIGLQNGDVIRSVNGHRLSSKQEAYQISRKARSQANVSIELMRDNKIETFSFHLGKVLVESRSAGRGVKADAVERTT
jgi:general secretion pathway protein C